MGDSAPDRWRLRHAADTCDFGAALARACPPPEEGPRLLFLSGELGAGKTTLAAALLETLGVFEPVRSPSYALIETYLIGWGQAVHVDCYRIVDAQELELLGLRDYYVSHALWLVEWPERAAAALPSPDLWVHLTVGAGERWAECTPKSVAGRGWLERLLKTWPYVINKT